MTDSEPYSWLFGCPPEPGCEACVIVPARNEEKNIEASLRAIARQIDGEGRALCYDRYEILLLLNNCTDRTAEVVCHFAVNHPGLRLRVAERHLPPDQANVGFVRRMLMDEACRRMFRIGRSSGAILSTDADTCVDARWIACNLKELAWGADAVGGRIFLQQDEYVNLAPEIRRNYLLELGHGMLVAEMESRLDPCQHDPWPRHHQHFCGSLAVRANAYWQAGGLPKVSHLEDVAFFHELVRRDGKIRHSPNVQVRTSARIDGRSPVGLAAHLNGFSNHGEPEHRKRLLVESAAFLEAKLRLQRRLRDFWSGECYSGHAKVAAAIGISASQLHLELTSGLEFGRILERLSLDENLDRKFGYGRRMAPIERVVADLRVRLHELRKSQHFETLPALAARAASNAREPAMPRRVSIFNTVLRSEKTSIGLDRV